MMDCKDWPQLFWKPGSGLKHSSAHYLAVACWSNLQPGSGHSPREIVVGQLCAIKQATRVALKFWDSREMSPELYMIVEHVMVALFSVATIALTGFYKGLTFSVCLCSCGKSRGIC